MEHLDTVAKPVLAGNRPGPGPLLAVIVRLHDFGPVRHQYERMGPRKRGERSRCPTKRLRNLGRCWHRDAGPHLPSVRCVHQGNVKRGNTTVFDEPSGRRTRKRDQRGHQPSHLIDAGPRTSAIGGPP